MRRATAAALVLWVCGGAAWSQEGAAGGQGAELYAKYCSQCHGDTGDGNGIATPFLKPAPRDFTSGKYKIRTTPTGGLPTDADLERSIKLGLPYSGMPAFPNFTAAQYAALIAHLKSFSPDFTDEEARMEPIAIPEPPAYDEASVERGRQVYAETGCARCHGEGGRGDGPSAPTLVDDWGRHIRVADLTMPWTFRAGGTRRDIFRTMSTGFNGTPMPGFHGSLPVEDIWAIVNFMVSLSGGPAEGERVEAPYKNLLRSVPTDEEIDLARGAELFAAAPPAAFPLFGQIVEPGRNFYPSAIAVTAQAIHNETEIAIRLTWHDMRAETVGTNAPELQVPEWAEQLVEAGLASAAAGEEDGGGGFWGDAAEDGGDTAGDDGGGDFWGDAAAPAEPATEPADDGGDFWGDAAAEEGGGEAGAGDDFWGEGEAAAAPAAGVLPAGPQTEFSDAVALQFPLKKPEGVRRPYFLFGDPQNAVDLWFVDLAEPERVKRYEGRGSAAVVPSEGGDPVSVVAGYDNGEWSVTFKRKRRGSGLSFDEDTFVPIAFTAWDGFNRERGNKRALSVWYELYVEPLERPSPVGPMVRAGLAVLVLEILFIALVRRRRRPAAAGTTTDNNG